MSKLHLFNYHFSFLAAAIPKNWPYKGFMQHKLLQLHESGTTRSISKRWEKGISVCQELEDEESLALGPGIAQGCQI